MERKPSFAVLRYSDTLEKGEVKSAVSIMRNGEEASRKAHNLEITGANPVSAPK